MMNVKVITSVVFIIIVIALSMTTLIIYYNTYYHWNTNPVAKRVRSMSPNQYVSKMNKLMTSQGMQCEKMSYPDSDKILLKWYWELVKEYSLFHRDGVRKLHSGRSREVRTLTWHCSTEYLCGGLGYRLLGITTNLLFAMATKRVLLLKWDKVSAENTYLLPNLIDWRHPNHTLDGSFKDLGSFHAGPMNEFKREMIKYLIGDTMHVQMLFNLIFTVDAVMPKLNKTMMNNVSLSKSKPNNLWLIHTVSFMNLFRITKELNSFADEIRNKLNLHGRRYVALHIRTGQFDNNLTEHPIMNRFTSTSNDTAEAMECAIKQANKHIGKDVVIVVVSDSASLKQVLSKKYSRVKVLDNKIVHVDKAAEIDKSEILGAWQDVIIMAEAHIVIYDHSAFPLLSVAMCGVPKKRIVNFKHCRLVDE